jgi:hypothetical protein
MEAASSIPPVSRRIVKTLILVTGAVPIVIYGAMPQLHRIRRVLISRRSL